MNLLVVMLIWWSAGSIGSGAATIQGFSSVAQCEKAMPEVHKFYDGVFIPAKIKCVELQP
jgi:hypothetical protein